MEILRVGSANLSVKAVKRRPEKVQKFLEEMFTVHGCQSVGIQEGGQARSVILAAARAVDASVYFGEGRPGEDSTPVMYLNSVRNPKFSSVQLTTRTPGDHRGAVDVIHPKYLVTVRYGFGGRRVKHNNLHGVVSQHLGINDSVAEKQFNAAARVVAQQRGPRFVSGDFNALPTNPNLIPFKRAGLVSSQVRLGTLPTRGRRAIDDIYCVNTKGIYVPKKHYTVKNPGDHLWYVLEGVVFPRLDKPTRSL